MKILSLFLLVLLVSCENIIEVIPNSKEVDSSSSIEINVSPDTISDHIINPISNDILDSYSCIEVSSNLINNGNFEMPSIPKSWYLLNKSDDPALSWEVEWKNNKPCGKNVLDARLELQRQNGNQVIELDSDCQGNNQFSMIYPVKKERVKTLIKQRLNAFTGSQYKITFKAKKRSDNVTEHLRVKLGKQRIVIKNSELTTTFQDFVFIKTLRQKDLTNNAETYLYFDPIGGKSDSLGLMLDDVSIVEVAHCPVKRKVCKTPSSVVSYSPVGNINETRKDSSKALGEPNGEPYSSSDIQFVSLGLGGEIIFKFSPSIKNSTLSDLRIYETSGGDAKYSQNPEEADVYGSNNLTKWVYLGKVKNDNMAPELGTVELGSMKRAKYIKLVDTSENNGDGFDVDALACLNQEETVFKPQVFYTDNSTHKLYKVKVNNKKVKLKEVLTLNNLGSHIASSLNNQFIYEVQGKYPNSLYIHHLKSKTSRYVFDLKIKETFQIGTSSTGRLYVGSSHSNKIYQVNPHDKTLIDLGHVYNNGSVINLKGGDIAFTDQGMYLISQANGGKLFKVSKDDRLEAEVISSGLGEVSGLAVLSHDEFLVSILRSEKMIQISSGIKKELTLKGDLLLQGTGADLSSNPEEGTSQF